MAKQQELPSGFIQQAMSRTSSSVSEGPKGLPREHVTFMMDCGSCQPGIFDNDFEVTLQSLTSAMELACAKAAKGDPTLMAFNMAKTSVCAVSGEKLKLHELDWFWEVLGPKGRALVLGQYVTLGAPSDEAQGKAEATARKE